MFQTSDYATLSNEQVLFIVDKFSTLAPYSHEFVAGVSDPQLLSGFVGAMSNFMQEMTGAEQVQWKTVYGSGSTFIVEGGEWTFGVLSVYRETSEVRSKLRRIVMEFEDSFASLKGADGIEGSAFKEFDRFVRRVFIDERLSENTVILRGNDWRDHATSFETPSQSFKIMKFLLDAETEQSLGQVAKKQNLHIEEVCNLSSQALWKNIIYLRYIPSAEDILALSEGSPSILLRKENAFGLCPDTFGIVAALDGKIPLYQFLEKIELEKIEKVMSELGFLINKGYINRISVEQRLVLVNECILSELANLCANAFGVEKAFEYMSRAQKIGITTHPWVGRVRITKDLDVQLILDASMTPLDLDLVYDALQFFIEQVTSNLAKDIGMKQAKKSHASVVEQCHKKWGRYLRDGII